MVSINHQTHANSSSSPTVHPASASRSRVKHILAPTDLGEASESSVKYALCFFLAGDPCALVVSAAKTLSIDLIVMVRHHRSWLSELIGRSDTERIARSADCPLLIVR
jgi:hypothetical protein